MSFGWIKSRWMCSICHFDHKYYSFHSLAESLKLMLFRCHHNCLSLFILHTIVSQFYPFLWLQLSSIGQRLSILYPSPISFLNFQSFTSSRRFSTSVWIYISLKWNVSKLTWWFLYNVIVLFLHENLLFFVYFLFYWHH